MPNDEVYVPMKGWVKPSCANCAEDHVECSIKAILRDHLIEYYQDRSGHLDTEDWEREKINFSQWHCSRWLLDTEESRLKVLERKIGPAEMQAILQEKELRLKKMKARTEADMEDERREIKESVLKQKLLNPEDYRIARIMEPWPPSDKITPEEQAKDLPLSLMSASQLNELQKPKGASKEACNEK